MTNIYVLLLKARAWFWYVAWEASGFMICYVPDALGERLMSTYNNLGRRWSKACDAVEKYHRYWTGGGQARL